MIALRPRRLARSFPPRPAAMFARPSRRRPTRRRPTRRPATANRRAGVSLTEVLMSLLVMGIGVTSVATLFPLAVLRGAKATQLTAGTILKSNAEQTVRFSRSPSLETPVPAFIGGVPTEFGGTDIVNPFPKGTSPGVDGLAMLLDPDGNGSPALCGPEALLGNTSIAWGPAGALYQASSGGTPRKFVVDPLGAATLAGDGNRATSPWFYGAFASAASAATDQFGTALGGDPVLRFAWPYPHEMIAAADLPANALLRRQMVETAYAVVGRAGDYSEDLDVTADVYLRDGADPAPDYLEVVFDNRDVEAGSLEEFYPQTGTDAAPAGADLARVVLFAPNERGSEAIPLSRLRETTTRDVIPNGGNSLLLAAPRADVLAASGLTLGATEPQRLRVRLERPDRRYSWMLTARKTGTGREEAEVAVYFNRALSAEDESVWRSERAVTPEGATSYVLFWDTAADTTVTPARPPQRNPQVQGGSWLLEMGELRWLRVGRVLTAEGDVSGAPAHVTAAFGRAGGTATATSKYLEFLLSSETPRRNEAGAAGPLYATFPRGVVSVYTLDP